MRSTTACASYGGFEHNSHGLRLVTELERRYADFDGLNLTQETLEGLVKHNGPLIDAAGRPLERYAKRGVPAAILAYDAASEPRTPHVCQPRGAGGGDRRRHRL